jgi:arylsulfatase
MMAHQDWLPTLLAEDGVPDVKEKLAQGYQANGKDCRVHIDGYNFKPFSKVKRRMHHVSHYFTLRRTVS